MNLKKIRESKGISQYRLSKLSGIPQSNICRIEAEDQNPGASSIIALCDALGCTADELLGRKGGS